jgi:precorrin-6Y C5,15-methyltransferase (decarboxylating)
MRRMDLPQESRDSAAFDRGAPWLAIVGIGEDGAAGLGAAARKLVAEAAIVFGGRRHLALAGALIRGEARPWPSPFDGAVGAVVACRGTRVCVLASGDPFHFGIGAILAAHVPAAEMIAVPAPSAFSLAAARLGWGLADVACLSLHGRPLDLLRPYLQPGQRVLVLTADGEAPAAIAGLVAGAGFGGSRLTVLEALGGSNERIRIAQAEDFRLSGIAPLNVLAIEVVAGPQALVIARAPGLPDGFFEHDGQITKREVRALVLSSLAPCRGERLWDVGAGAGSVAIEWLLADPSLAAIAIEARPERAARIRRNAARLGVPGLAVVEGTAPAALAGLPAPAAIFVGGGAGDAGVLDRCLAALAPGGRLVVNAVTLQTEEILIRRHAELGGELTRIAIERAGPVGAFTAWRPAIPLVLWRHVKP